MSRPKLKQIWHRSFWKAWLPMKASTVENGIDRYETEISFAAGKSKKKMLTLLRVILRIPGLIWWARAYLVKSNTTIIILCCINVSTIQISSGAPALCKEPLQSQKLLNSLIQLCFKTYQCMWSRLPKIRSYMNNWKSPQHCYTRHEWSNCGCQWHTHPHLK